MPIEEISDYPEKMTEFELHWASVNAALGGSPATDFKLQRGYAVAQFSSDKAAIIGVLDDLIALENQLTFARSDRLVAGAVSYKIYQMIVGPNQNYELVGPAMMGPATLSNLPPGATIRVRLTALNANGESEPGAHTEITLPAPLP